MPETRNGRTHPGDGVFVRSRQCATCIYHKHLDWDLEKLENDVRHPDIPEVFTGFRECHHGDDEGKSGTVCRGFYNEHADASLPLMLARALNGIIEV